MPESQTFVPSAPQSTGAILTTPTITSPTVTGGTFDTPTITAPAITGGTASGQAISGATITTSTVDGVSEAQFDLIANGAKATATSTFKAYAAMANNQTLIVPGPVTFELQKEGAYATGSITAVAKAQILDNETFVLNDGVNAATTFEFQVTPNVYATGSITAVAKANLIDGEQFVLNDGVNPAVTFEFDVAGDGVTGGTTAVDVSGATDADSVAVIIRAAINGVVGGLAITAGAPTGAVVPLTNDAYGAYNTAITDTVADIGFTTTGMSGGSVFTPAGGGVVVCDLTGATTDAQVATALRASINGIVGGLAITAGAPTGAVIPLTNDAYGAYNTAITDTVTNVGFTHTGMTGGVAWTPTGGAVVVVDARGVSTQAAVIALFGAAVTANATSTIAYVSETGGVASWIAKAYGTAVNNSSITGTTLSVPGVMSGGKAVLTAIDVSNLLLGGATATANANPTLTVLASKTIAVPAAGSLWRGLDIQASTLTLVAGGTVPSSLSLAYIAAPTITSAAAYVVPTASTLTIAGPPVAMGSASITRSYSLQVLGVNSIFGNLSTGGTATPTKLSLGNSYGTGSAGARANCKLCLYDDTTVNNYAGLGMSAGLIEFYIATGGSFAFFPNGSTSSALAVSSTGGVGINVAHGSVGASTALRVNADKSVVSAGAAVWNGVDFEASTLTLTGATTPVTALSFFNVAAPTITSASAITVASAATVYIAGPPVAAGSTTITAPYAIWSDAGDNRFDGTVSINVGGAATGGTKLDVNGNVYLRGGTVFVDALQDYTGSGLNCANVSMFKGVNNFVVGAAAAGATAAKCLALSNSATAPTASADLCHLYSADNGAGHATLAIYAEEVVAAVGVKTVTEVLPVFINGTLKYIALAA